MSNTLPQDAAAFYCTRCRCRMVGGDMIGSVSLRCNDCGMLYCGSCRLDATINYGSGVHAFRCWCGGGGTGCSNYDERINMIPEGVLFVCRCGAVALAEEMCDDGGT